MSTFWKDTIPGGYYDSVVGTNKYGLASIQLIGIKSRLKMLKNLLVHR